MPTKTKRARKSAGKKTVRKQTKKTTRKRVAKKAAKRKASKRSVVRSRKATQPRKSAKAKRSPRKRALICVDGEACFWTTDGQVLASLADLEQSLHTMAEDVFAYHVTKEKNDFADWVDGVLLDRTLARALRRSQKPSTARTVVVRRLKLYDL